MSHRRSFIRSGVVSFSGLRLIPFLMFCICTAAQAQTVANNSFETPALAVGTYQYNATGGTWTFAGNSGIAHNGSGFGNPNAPHGAQVAFLQGINGANGSITQSVSFSAGSYTLSFSAAQRSWSGQQNTQSIHVQIDGVTVSTLSPSSTSFATYATSVFSVTAGTHTVGLVGASTSGDQTAFIDSVTITSTAVGPPGYTYVADEGQSYTFSTLVDVAYGANGSFNYMYGVTGTIWFNNTTFGDPIPGTFKYGFYRLAAGGTPPTFQAAGSPASSTGTVTPVWPAHQAGDVALLIVETANQAVSLSSPAGFVAVTGSPQGTGSAGGTAATRVTVYWKRAASSSEPNPTVADSGNHQTARILTFRGVIASGNPWDVTAGNVASSASTSVSIPGATTTVDNTLVVAIVANATDTTSAGTSGWANSNLTSLTERADHNTSSGNGGGFGVATGVKATAGVYGTTTATLATSSVQARLSIALKPTSGGGSPPPAPTGLAATPGNGQVALSWNASAGADNYNVKRSTTSGSGYSTIASLTTTSYTNTGLTNGTTYYYVVSAVNGSGESANSSQVSATPAAPSGGSGTISREVWTGIAGNDVSLIPLTTPPSSTGTLTLFESPTDTGDNYGQRVRGYLHAPQTGSYTFWISSDDDSELWLSTNDQAGSKILIASVDGWTTSREWGKYASQKSSAISLTGGQRYYVEALMKEGGGGDNLAVGWAKPGQSTTAPSEVIPGAQLGPWDGGSTGPNSLFTNAGFENDLTGWTNNGSSSISTDAASGAKAVVTGTGQGGVQQQISYASTTPININVRAKVSGAISGWCGMGIDFLDSSGTEVDEVTFGVTATTYAAWVLNNQAIPTGTASLRFWTWKPGTSGSLFVDDVEVTQGSATPPPAPTGLTATPGNAQVALSWNASTGATSYNVKRSTTSGSGYSTIASPTSTSYTNIGLTNGVTYYYVVSAVNGFGQSANSSQVSATPQASSGTYQLGIGLGAPLDYEADVTFADAIKVGRAITSNSGSYDANGWPTDDGNIGVWYGAQAALPTLGTYTLKYDGQANVTIGIGAGTISSASYDAATDTSTRTVTITGESDLRLDFTGTTRGIRNVKLMRPIAPGSSTPHGTSEMWYRPMKDLVSRFQWIRLMDFTATNGNGQTTWSGRTKPGRWSQQNTGLPGDWWQGRGAAWEYCVHLANETNKDLWINVPALADADYVTKLAQLIRYGSDGSNPYTSGNWNDPGKVWQGLNPNLKIYVEYSNEIWNFGFPMWTQILAAATAEVNADPNSVLRYDGSNNDGDWTYRYWARGIKNASEAFRVVFGDAAMMTRVRPLFETQAGWQNWIAAGLNFLNNYYNNGDGVNHVANPHPVNYYLWGAGGSTYIMDYVSSTLKNSDTATVDDYFNSGYPNAFAEFDERMQLDVDWCRAFGLKRVGYEGGTGIDGSGHADEVKYAVQVDPRIKQVYIDQVNHFVQAGGDMWTNFLGANEAHGIYPTYDTTDLNTYKRQAIDQLNTSTAPPVTYGILVPATMWGNRFRTSDGGWPGGFDNATLMTPTSRWRSWTIRSNSTATYTLRVNAGCANANGRLNVELDGQFVGQLVIPNTGDVNTFTDSAGISITIPAGQHGIRLIQAGSETFNINQVKIQ